jgi:hypothetical protein
VFLHHCSSVLLTPTALINVDRSWTVQTSAHENVINCSRGTRALST